MKTWYVVKWHKRGHYGLPSKWQTVAVFPTKQERDAFYAGLIEESGEADTGGVFRSVDQITGARS